MGKKGKKGQVLSLIDLKFLLTSVFVVLLYAKLLFWLFFKTRFPYEGWDFIAPVISLVLAYFNYQNLKKSKKMAKKLIKPEKRAILLIVLAFVLQFWGIKIDSWAYQLFSFIFMVSGLMIYAWGLEIFSYFVFPLAFLIFKLPFGGYLISFFGTEGLNSFQAKLVAIFSSWVGVPSESHGIYVVSKVTSRVIPRCSGWYTVDAKLLLGTLFIYYAQNPIKTRIVKFLWLLPIITIINFLRIFTLHLAWNILDGKFPTDEIHDISNHLHKVVLLVFFYYFAFGFSNKKVPKPKK